MNDLLTGNRRKRRRSMRRSLKIKKDKMKHVQEERRKGDENC
jgi:hypothetical protein